MKTERYVPGCVKRLELREMLSGISVECERDLHFAGVKPPVLPADLSEQKWRLLRDYVYDSLIDARSRFSPWLDLRVVAGETGDSELDQAIEVVEEAPLGEREFAVTSEMLLRYVVLGVLLRQADSVEAYGRVAPGRRDMLAERASELCDDLLLRLFSRTYGSEVCG